MSTRLAMLCICLALAVEAAAQRDSACPEPLTRAAQPSRIAVEGLRVGLALGSGSSHGFAHIGVIEELEARGLDVHVVTGTSVGALVGALWASGLSGVEIETLARAGVWDGGSLSASWQGFFSNTDLRKQLTAQFRGRAIEKWPRRFGAVATNLGNGHRRILMSGDGALAVQASSAVPVLFAPVWIDGEKLADGVLVEPVPVDAARALGADYVIAVDVAYRPYEDKADRMTDYAFQSIHILVNTLGERQLREADHALRLDVHHLLMACGSDAVVAAGREAVRRTWPELARSLQKRVAARNAITNRRAP